MVLVLLQWKLAHCFFSSGVAKACIAVRESEGSVNESLLSVTHIKEGSALIAASFTAASARLLPRDTKSSLLECATHLQIAIDFGSKIASSNAAILSWFRTGLPADFRNFLCFHNAPKS